MKSAGNNFILKLSKTPPVTVDLPASGGVPEKIVLTGEMTASVTLYIAADCFWTVAENDADGATRLSNDATRFKMPSGFLQIDISGCHDYNLYVKSQAVGATVDGIAYAYSEFS